MKLPPESARLRASGTSLSALQPVRMAGAPGTAVAPRAWIGPALSIAALVSLLYARILAEMFKEWWHSPILWHGFVVIAFAALFIGRKWRQLVDLPPHPSWAGLAIVALSLAILLVGILGSEFFLTRSSLLFLLAGLVIYFLGWKHFRLLLVPWAFLFLMIPIPALVLNQLLIPLKFLSAKLGVLLLKLLGVPLFSSDDSIQLPWIAMGTLDAGRGLDALMSLASLTVIYGYVSEKSVTVRLALVAAVFPVLLVTCALRLGGTGALGMWGSPEAAESFYHAYAGLGVFVCSALLILAAHRPLRFLIDKLRGTRHA